MPSKGRNEFRNFKLISKKSNRITGYIFSQNSITKLTRNRIKGARKTTGRNYEVHVRFYGQFTIFRKFRTVLMAHGNNEAF